METLLIFSVRHAPDNACDPWQPSRKVRARIQIRSHVLGCRSDGRNCGAGASSLSLGFLCSIFRAMPGLKWKPDACLVLLSWR